MWQKRPMTVANEPYARGKRTLCMWQKSAMYVPCSRNTKVHDRL